MLLNKKAQSTLEYAVVIAVVVAGLIAMQAYIKRGMQGKLKQASDDIGEQYSPGRTLEDTTVQSDITSQETVSVAGGLPTTNATSSQTQNRTHSSTVQDEKGEWWGDK
jgi:uncharacterized protein (UPF0333 family)